MSKVTSMLEQLASEVWIENLTIEEMQSLVLMVIEDVIEQIKEIEDKAYRLNEAENLLHDAHSLLDDVHCYETEIFEEIGIFLYGEDDE